jgi:subtilisin family serine protease
VEPDPPTLWIQADTLVYGITNMEAEVVWGGFPQATSVIPGNGGAEVKVAVIDTGIDCGHPDLAGNCIIGARGNGFGVIGVAPEATSSP